MEGLVTSQTWKDLIFSLAKACNGKTISDNVYIYDLHEMLNAEINIEHYEGDEYIRVNKRGEGDSYYEIMCLDGFILAGRLMDIAEEIVKLCMLKGDYSIWKGTTRWHVRHDDWELFIDSNEGIDEFMTGIDKEDFTFAELRRYLRDNDIEYDYEIDLPF